MAFFYAQSASFAADSCAYVGQLSFLYRGEKAIIGVSKYKARWHIWWGIANEQVI